MSASAKNGWLAAPIAPAAVAQCVALCWLEACGLQMAKVPLRARCDVAAFLLALFTCPTVVVIRIEHLLPRAGRH